MANQFSVEKIKVTKTRKIPFLPRFGVYVDFAGRQFSYKQAPLIETLVNLFERGFSRDNFIKVAFEELNEIQFSPLKIRRKKTTPAPKKARAAKVRKRAAK